MAGSSTRRWNWPWLDRDQVTRRRPSQTRLDLESLENRTTPTTSAMGIPWSTPGLLSLSFVPDNTSVSGVPSTLGALLGGTSPEKREPILRAFQTWAVNGNINLRLVSDGGQSFGSAGAVQGDSRFGDIRIGAMPIGGDAMAVAVPNGMQLSGSWAGDILFNANKTYVGPNATSLLAVTLHEAGHAFGIVHITDNGSVMRPNLTNPAQTTLGLADIAAIQSLYGVRAADDYEGSSGNSTIDTATTITNKWKPSDYDGKTPLLLFGDLTTASDIDTYKVRTENDITGSVTFQVRTNGVSLLKPKLTIYDKNGVSLGTAQSTTLGGDTVQVTLPSVSSDTNYYIRVQGAAGDVFGVGRYALSMTYNSKVTTTADDLDRVIRTAGDGLSAKVLRQAMVDPTRVLFGISNPGDDTDLEDPNGPLKLKPTPGYTSRTQYDTIASMEGATDVDVFRVKAPSGDSTKPIALLVSARNLDGGTQPPIVVITDPNGQAREVTVLSNGAGVYTVQATGLLPNKLYTLSVTPNTRTPGAGNYALSATFNTTPAVVQFFNSTSLTGSKSSVTQTLEVNRSQFFQYILAVDVPSNLSAANASKVGVKVSILDSEGRERFAIGSRGREVRSGDAILLTPGTYAVRYTALTQDGSALPNITARLSGSSISDPIGPEESDPSENPDGGSGGGGSGDDPFVWIVEPPPFSNMPPETSTDLLTILWGPTPP